MSRKVADSTSAVWAIPSACGTAVVEVCSTARPGKFVVVVAGVTGGRYQRSRNGMRFERAQADAQYMAGQKQTIKAMLKAARQQS